MIWWFTTRARDRARSRWKDFTRFKQRLNLSSIFESNFRIIDKRCELWLIFDPLSDLLESYKTEKSVKICSKVDGENVKMQFSFSKKLSANAKSTNFFFSFISLPRTINNFTTDANKINEKLNARILMIEQQPQWNKHLKRLKPFDDWNGESGNSL